MNQHTVDYLKTAGGVGFLSDVTLFSVSNSDDLALQFPRSPIIGASYVGDQMTREWVVKNFRDNVMVGPVPSSAGYWDFPGRLKLDYTGLSHIHSPPEYGIVGEGGGDPLNSFMPNPVSAPDISDPTSQPRGWDAGHPALKDRSDEMIELKRASSFGWGNGTLLSPKTSVDTFRDVSAWRRPAMTDEEINAIGKYDMGTSGMSLNPSR